MVVHTCSFSCGGSMQQIFPQYHSETRFEPFEAVSVWTVGSVSDHPRKTHTHGECLLL